MSRYISENVERRLYAESMGYCMNPECHKPLFSKNNGDIIEKAHIDPYCKGANNTFENLIILCPNCHTEFDKNNAFSAEEVLSWKHIRQQEIDHVFGVNFRSFDELKKAIVPLLQENKTIYEQYYLSGNKELWEKFEHVILINNKKLFTLLSNNTELLQKCSDKDYSNLELVNQFLLHVHEFEGTRGDEEKVRQVLFPDQINSIFGLQPIKDHMMPYTESLEHLIKCLINDGKHIQLQIGCENPYLVIDNGQESQIVYLNDTPQLRQLYYNYHCFRKVGVRLDSLNFTLQYLNKNGVHYDFIEFGNLRNILINGKKIQFVYKYCLNKAFLIEMAPPKNSIVVNLHNWNGECCISTEAYDFASNIGVTLKSSESFFRYVHNI